MPENLYQILGVDKNAKQDDIKKAYRKLTKKLHPDLNPGDDAAEERFKTVASAYDILGKPDSRAKYDAGEIDESGAEKPRQQYYRQYADQDSTHAYQSNAGFEDMADLNDLFSGMYRQQQQQRAQAPQKGGDIRYHLKVSFLEAALGASKQVQMADGANLSISIPKGIETEKTLRLKGKGQLGYNNGPAGDALIQIDVEPHPVFTRNGQNIDISIPISISEAALGGKIEVPTIHGLVGMTVPAGSDSGKVLRLKGRGIESKSGGKGDQMVILTVQMPEVIDEDLASFLGNWKEKHNYDPRQKLKGDAYV